MMKQAQLTATVLLGVIIVAAVVAVFFARETQFFTKSREDLTSALTLPDHARKTKETVESCIRDVTNKGVDLLEAHGGYITLPYDPLAGNPLNPFSNTLDLFGNGQTLIPLWYHRTVTDTEKIIMPDLVDIQQELARYIQEHLTDCLSTFETLTRQGIRAAILENPKTRVSISNEAVNAEVRMKTDVERDGATYQLETFTATTPRRLGKLLKTAQEIFRIENQDHFLEKYLYDMMVVYDDIPLSGVDFECTPRTWKKTDIAAKLKRIFATNIPLIRIKGTQYELSDDARKSLVVNSVKDIPRDVAVSFLYSPDWWLLMDILDEDAEIIRGKPFASESELSQFVTPLFCLNQYHFVYNIKTPILVTLYDAETNEIFQFGTLAVIDHNQPRRNTVETPPFGEETPICQHPTTTLKVYALSYDATDELRSLADARVTLKCITTTCTIGATRLEDADYALTAKFPSCWNAELTATKQGYAPGTVTLSTNEEATISVILEPEFTLPVKTMVLTDSGTRPLQPTEQAVFLLAHTDQDYTTTITTPGTPTATLIAGTYTVKAYLIVQNAAGFTLEGKTIKSCTDIPKPGILGIAGLTEKRCETATIEPLKLDQIASGTAEYTWTVTRNELRNANELVLSAIRNPDPRTVEDLTRVNMLAPENSKRIPQPELR